MNTDLALAVGITISVLAVPSIFSALSDGRAPRAASIAVLVGGGLVVFALTSQPGGYQFADIPEVFYRVAARFF